jgi:heterodisulfide reductase subunit B
MRYLYYPGCSLEGTALEYDASTRAFMQAAGAELFELEDWTCCGATAAESTSHLLSLALPARNLAVAGRMDEGGEILVPCSACYLNLKKVEVKIRTEPGLRKTINTILSDDHLHVDNRVKVRHLLDVVSQDLGPEPIQTMLKRSFEGFRIAPYYGCQCLRPYAVFDDPESPESMESILEATGAAVHTWTMGGKCCGASHMNTKPEVGLELVAAILRGARGADAIVTVCPMCQMNLEAFQKKIAKEYGEKQEMTVLYLPQLLGLAIGLSEKEVRLDLNLSVTPSFHEKLGNP